MATLFTHPEDKSYVATKILVDLRIECNRISLVDNT